MSIAISCSYMASLLFIVLRRFGGCFISNVGECDREVREALVCEAIEFWRTRLAYFLWGIR